MKDWKSSIKRTSISFFVILIIQATTQQAGSRHRVLTLDKVMWAKLCAAIKTTVLRQAYVYSDVHNITEI